MAEAGISIQSAHIDSYGERAVDAFYVQIGGGKLTEPRKIAAVRAALLQALDDSETAPPTKLRLQRARASVAR